MNLADPRAAETCSAAGFDCPGFCREHVPGDGIGAEGIGPGRYADRLIAEAFEALESSSRH